MWVEKYNIYIIANLSKILSFTNLTLTHNQNILYYFQMLYKWYINQLKYQHKILDGLFPKKWLKQINIYKNI